MTLLDRLLQDFGARQHPKVCGAQLLRQVMISHFEPRNRRIRLALSCCRARLMSAFGGKGLRSDNASNLWRI
jgi:hypothetical protein